MEPIEAATQRKMLKPLETPRHFSEFSDISAPWRHVAFQPMNWKKWTSVAASTALARRYPVLWTATLFAAVPVLLRSASSLVERRLLLALGEVEIECAPFIASAAFVPGVVGFLKYGSRGHILAYALWLVTFLSAAVLGIVMFEAFSPPREWSGSLVLPALVVKHCFFGAVVGAIVLRIPWYRRRIGRRASR